MQLSDTYADTLTTTGGGGTPYGASTLAGGDGSRQVSANELDGARFLGRHVAQIAAKLAA